MGWGVVGFGTLVYWTASVGLRPFAILETAALGATEAQIGLVVACYPAASLLLAFYLGRVTDRLGLVRVLSVSGVLMALVGVLYSQVNSVAMMALAQTLCGIIEIPVWICYQMAVGRASDGPAARRGLWWLSMGWGLGLAAGPAIGSWVYGNFGFEQLGFFYAGLALVVALTAVGIPRHQPSADEPAATAGNSLADLRRMLGRPAVRFALLSTYVTLGVAAIRGSFYPVTLERMGFSVGELGSLLALVGACALVMRAVVPLTIGRVHPARLLLIGGVVSTLALTATPFLHVYWYLAAAAVLLGFGEAVGGPLTVSLLGSSSASSEQGAVMGIRLFVNRISMIVHPAAFGLVSGLAAVGPTYLVIGAVLLATCLLMATQERRARLG